MRLNHYLFSAAALNLLLLCSLHAEVTGPSPRLSGAPGDGTCLECHGTRANANGGSVTMTAAGGTTYTPGQKTRITVTVADPSARVWGFQASPRQSSSGATGAGTMAPLSDGYTQLLKSGVLQWIEQTYSGARPGSSSSASFQFDWTAPATAVGNVDFYVAANAGNDNGRDDSGDHIYTAKMTLTPQAAAPSASKPTIAANGVVDAFSSSATSLAPGTWVTVYGTSLSGTSRSWTTADFKGNIGPASLDGVSATVNGKTAVLNYVNPGQVNIQIPTDAGTGASSLVLTSPGGASDSYPLTLTQFAPVLNQNAAFSSNGRNYVVAQFADGAFVGPVGLIPGANFRPAQAGDTITIFGLGFGPLQPALATGQIANGVINTANPVTFQIGGKSVTPSFAGAAPGFVGAYQLNVTIPAGAGSGDVAFSVSAGGVSTAQSLFLTLQ